MKRIISIIFLLTCIGATNISAATGADSLLNSRNSLYYQYLDIKNNTEEFKQSDYVKLVDVLEQVLFLDNRLMDTLDANQKKLQEAEKQLVSQDNSAIAISSEMNHKSFCNWIVYIGGGLLFVLLIVFFAFFMIKNSKLVKFKRQFITEQEQWQKSVDLMKEELAAKEAVSGNNNESLKKAIQERDQLEEKVRKLDLDITVLRTEKMQAVAELETKVQQLTENLKRFEHELPHMEQKLKEKESLLQADSVAYQTRVEKYEKQIDEINANLNVLKCNHDRDLENIQILEQNNELQKSEITELKKSISEKEIQIAEFRSLSAHDDKYYLKLAEVDLNMIKLENLEKLKEKKTITDEEYQILKQKLLGQL